MTGSRRIWRKPVIAMTATAALTLTMAGCAVSPTSESARQESAFSDLYAQAITWGECNDDFGMSESLLETLGVNGLPGEALACGMVTAPFDWDDPANDETIELATVHISATGPGDPLGTLLSNPGGPGASGLGLAYSLPTDPGFGTILENYDILGFDPRGIGRSTPVGCEPVSSIEELNLAICADEAPLAASISLVTEPCRSQMSQPPSTFE